MFFFILILKPLASQSFPTFCQRSGWGGFFFQLDFYFHSLVGLQSFSLVLPKQPNVWSRSWLLTKGHLRSESFSTRGYRRIFFPLVLVLVCVCGWVRMRRQLEICLTIITQTENFGGNGWTCRRLAAKWSRQLLPRMFFFFSHRRCKFPNVVQHLTVLIEFCLG